MLISVGITSVGMKCIGMTGLLVVLIVELYCMKLFRATRVVSGNAYGNA